jgi:CheY-like chemotaxis protein
VTYPGRPTRRPVLLTVDDDVAVSRAIARDLRKRYGDDYRVVRAETGPSALEALRDFSLRGEKTALLLADHRMPGMTGVDFLEAAMDFVPGAKRVLLTAYADTDAAIRAINDVDLDRYLLKPWDPPEDRLYPVVDELLAAVVGAGASKFRRIDADRAPVVVRHPDGQGVPRPKPGPVPPPGRALRRRATPAGHRPAARRRGRAPGRPAPGRRGADPSLIT